MIEIFPNLYVGSDVDRDLLAAGAVTGTAVNGVPEGWFVISAAKTAHKAELGYTGNAAPKTMIEDGKEVPHPEYLYAVRPRRLILNLIDGPDPKYIPDEIVTVTMQTINLGLGSGKTLIHCNQGHSRAPTLALLWLHGLKPSLAETEYAAMSYDDAAAAFKVLYPEFAPAAGMEGYARAHWEAE